MARSFYHYLLKFRDGTKEDPFVRFANGAYFDHSFPKMSTDYDEISRYLELNGDYLDSMTIFDELWEQFLREA
ncbi:MULTISPECIES: YozE family protein [Parageobacillus]|jgi:uncharacterized protein YozE (UPF0346 family)|uniref:UPF0346 protein A7K69_07585 n=1 Tax=Parageobacillus thermoglucosidasius TaxID=1426 RepID=A0A1B7KRS9_PARTM|nr:MULTISPECIES: YozE family protein [Parageobacillus]OAT72794.1 hypothetical protein A7K69_07585 [Parageobacillus thermoglucosidasius]BDG47060.1 UPF0346 protein YozE [Parageobacillus sp. KH3-4]